MVHLIIAVRITADVSVTVLGCTPFLDGTCQMQGGILCRMGEGVGHFGDLTCRVCVEMGPGTVMPSQNIAGIGGSPATEGHSPAYGTV